MPRRPRCRLARVVAFRELPRLAGRNRGQRVLVVDDNGDAAASLAQLLEMEHNEVRTAAEGEEAIEQARAFRPQIIFMDLGMPRLDGVEAARRIRKLPPGNCVRIIALTGHGKKADRQRTQDAGMDHHLIKPVMDWTHDFMNFLVEQLLTRFRGGLSPLCSLHCRA